MNVTVCVAATGFVVFRLFILIEIFECNSICNDRNVIYIYIYIFFNEFQVTKNRRLGFFPSPVLIFQNIIFHTIEGMSNTCHEFIKQKLLTALNLSMFLKSFLVFKMFVVDGESFNDSESV